MKDAHRAALSAAKKGKPLSELNKAGLRLGQRRRMARPGERERLAAMARDPGKRERQRRFAVELARRPHKRSLLEKRFEALLEEAGVEYSVQFPAGGYAFDFRLKAAPVLIEVDGCYWHGCSVCGYAGNAKTKVLDVVKNAWAEANGFLLIRVKEHAL